jgi:hypothetical protein
MFGNLEEVHDAEKAGLAGEGGGDIRKADGLDGIDLDVSFFHGVASADADVEPLPDADGTGDFTAADGVAKALREGHRKSLQRAKKIL